MESSSTIVVKVGTSSILRGDSGHLALSTLASLVETLTTLRQAGHRVVLVSSGAVGVGCQRLNVKTRPSDHAELQALAAVGQPHLMAHYETLFSALKQPIAQVLLNPDALGSRPGYLNAQATLEKLLAMGVVPVVNENDTVAVSELRFGDNDSLSALVAVLVGADHLFLATDVDALYTKNPSAPLAPGEAPAEPIRVVQDIGSVLGCAVGGGSQWGTGGMATKLRAAQLAAAAGIATSILSAQQPALVATLLGGSREVGTTFLPGSKPLRSHKRWIMALPPRGALTLDAGAARGAQRLDALRRRRARGDGRLPRQRGGAHPRRERRRVCARRVQLLVRAGGRAGGAAVGGDGGGARVCGARGADQAAQPGAARGGDADGGEAA